MIERSTFFTSAAVREARRLHRNAAPRQLPDAAAPRRAGWRASYEMPNGLTQLTYDFAARNQDELLLRRLDRPVTAIDNMTPGNPFLKTLRSLPVAPGIAAHSIIAVEGAGPADDGADGVVKYKSAHLDDVESERVVRSGHSCQGHPDTIEEVRRILREHAGL